MIVKVEVNEPQARALNKQELQREALKKLARRWRAEGHTYQAIAEACGRSIPAVWAWCRDVPRGVIK